MEGTSNKICEGMINKRFYHALKEKTFMEIHRLHIVD